LGGSSGEDELSGNEMAMDFNVQSQIRIEGRLQYVDVQAL
jgi:hypothetical protein